MMPGKALAGFAMLCALLAASRPQQANAQTPLRVAAAADLEPVLPPILDQFGRATGIPAEATYQASAILTSQIQNGAPFDIFLSADTQFPRRLLDAGFAEGSAPTVYAQGTLVLWTPNAAHLPPPSLDLLRSAQIKRLSIANPESAPYGRAAVAALRSLNLYDALSARLATAQNIAQAAQFVDSGNADAGLISLTLALTPRLAANGRYFVMPRDAYPPIAQGAVVLKRSQQQQAAHKLLNMLLTPAVQAQFAKSGLTPVN
jgi:molybdate transport system substrate-binding protein